MTYKSETDKKDKAEQSMIYEIETHELETETQKIREDETTISSTENSTESVTEAKKIKEKYVNNIVYLRATKEIREDNVVGVVDCGVLVNILEQDKEWSLIEYKNTQYYIKSQFLQDEVPEPIVTEPETSEQIIEKVEEIQPKVVSTPTPIISFNDSDFELLCKLVQHEAGNQDYFGKQLVACVVINRVLSPLFPNSISEVVFAPNQFTPTSYDNFWEINVAEETQNAVKSVLYNENNVITLSQGALFFNTPNATWMDSRRILFQHGNHIFLK